MGSFSWLKAAKGGCYRNIYRGCRFKFLIPKEFGGGYIIDDYQDYGYLGSKEDGSPKHDMYELLAIWNNHMITKNLVNADNPLKEIDEFTPTNRIFGIDIGCYDEDIDKLKYPLKLVDADYEGTYESCPGKSYGDPDQGFEPVEWDGSYVDDEIEDDDFDDYDRDLRW